MKPDYSKHATIQEIRERFDKDTERFSNLETGQVATVDAPITMDYEDTPQVLSGNS
jgi:tRNA (cmo5U34)-methyltransferase